MTAGRLRRVIGYAIFFGGPLLTVLAMIAPEFWYGADAKVPCLACQGIDAVVPALISSEGRRVAMAYAAVRVALQWYLPLATVLGLSATLLPPVLDDRRVVPKPPGVGRIVFGLVVILGFLIYFIYLDRWGGVTDLGRNRIVSPVFMVALGVSATVPGLVLCFSRLGRTQRQQ